MRILLVHKFFRLTGGADVFFFETGRILEENGHEVAYFSTNHPDNVQTQWNPYFIDPPEYSSNSTVRKIFSIKDVIYSRKANQAFAKLLEDFKPDIIHAFAIYTHLTPSIFEAAKEANVPVVMSCNDYKHICPNYKLYDGKKICEACKGGKFYNAVVRKCCQDSMAFSVASSIEAYVHAYRKVHDRLVHRYLFASEFMLNKTREFWADRKIEYGVLKNPFKASDYEPVFSGDYALYFGRIIIEKGVDRIIEAAAEVTLPIKIVGDGPDLDMLKKEAEERGLDHVEFLGPVWGDELKPVLSGSRFVIVPSLWHENFPYVIFQAFAAGKPVLGTRRGGIPELLGNDRGVLFDPDSTRELADELMNMWNNPASCGEMGRSARDYIVKEFSDEAFYKSVMANYKAVIE